MKLDVAGLQAFVAIPEHGSFQKAATALKLSQAGLSRRVQRLEVLLGVRLIARTTRSWQLTDAGSDLLPKAEHLLLELKTTLANVGVHAKRQPEQVAIACVSSIAFHFLPRILVEYCAAFPASRLQIIDGRAHEITEAVLSGRADFGINVLPTRDTDVETELLLRDPYVVMLKTNHRLARRRSITWAELGNEPVILFRRNSESGIVLDRAVSRLISHLNSVYEVQHPTTALGLVLAGAGIAILPSLGGFRGSGQGVRGIPLISPAVHREIGLLRLKNKTMTSEASRFYDVLMDELAHSSVGHC